MKNDTEKVSVNMYIFYIICIIILSATCIHIYLQVNWGIKGHLYIKLDKARVALLFIHLYKSNIEDVHV